MKRSCGILLHISSLPSPYGIGTLGKEAFRFVDFLKSARQSHWQVLPLGQTGYGDSPYQSFSTFAGNPYFVDLERLIEDDLLERSAVEACDWGGDARYADFGRVYESRARVLYAAFERARLRADVTERVERFSASNADWLDDYALFMALKDENGGKPWHEWERGVRLREESAMDAARERLSMRMEFYRFIQTLFFEQWVSLVSYAHTNGVSLIGDLPIYVPFDSADVWSAPSEFLLDEERRPTCVAGVPPDYFTADGQLWGNPIYDWAHMRENGYAWWKRRLSAAARMYDTIRIDHFRGLASYWSVPPTAPTARTGEWMKGPGSDFVNMVKTSFSGLQIIAEDLGYLTQDVIELLKESGLPGMKVLQFAFDAREPSVYLPHTYPRNCVCYAGTHDNTTTAAWFAEAAQDDVRMAIEYLGLNEREGYVWGMLRGGMGSVADLFLAQMQDYIGLDGSCRMNTPGTRGGNNWRWRMRSGENGAQLAARIAEMVRIYGR